MVDRRKALAYHEAGHAVAMLSFGAQIESCRISERAPNPFYNDEDGETNPAGGAVATDKQSLVIAWAGPIAELKVDPYADVARSDQQAMKKTLQSFAGTLSQQIDELHKAAKEACELVERQWAAIERIGDALAVEGTLSGDRVHALYELSPPE